MHQLARPIGDFGPCISVHRVPGEGSCFGGRCHTRTRWKGNLLSLEINPLGTANSCINQVGTKTPMGAGPGFPAGTGCLQPDLPAFRTETTQLTLQLIYINDTNLTVGDLS